MNSASWVRQVHDMWPSAKPGAVIKMRLDWSSIDEDALAQAAAWTEEARTEEARAEEARTGEGRREGGHVRLFAVTFENVLRLVAASEGDPFAPPGVRAASRTVISAPVGPALIEETDSLVRELLPDLDEHLASIGDDGDRATARLQLAMVAACLALPRADILRLAGQLPKIAADAPDRFGDVLQAAIDLRVSQPEQSEDLLVEALELASPSSGPENQLVLRMILGRKGRPLKPDTLRACTRRLSAMAAAGSGGDAVAWNLGIVAAKANAAELAPELFPALAQAAEALIERDLSPQARLAAGIGAAEQWLRLGRLDRSDIALWRLRQAIGSPACRLQTAVVEADARALYSDLHGARDVLVSALEAVSDDGDSDGIALEDRRKAVLHLIQDWPVDRQGPVRPAPPGPGQQDLGYWIGQALRLIDASQEHQRNALRVQLLTTLYKLGAYDQAAALRHAVDLETWRESSADYREWKSGTEDWVARQAAEAAGESGAGESGPAGDAGKDYATLGLEQRFPEAAAMAESDAATALARGFRVQAYDHLVAAARLHRLARDREAALSAYQRAFALLENDLMYLPYAELVVRRLAEWPELYQLAAITALQLGDPVRAVALAETGRSRATGSRLGRFRRQPPDGVSQADWAEFGQLWRGAVADAANALVRDPGPAGAAGLAARPAVSPRTGRINELRRQFFLAGVPAEELAPVGPPADTAAVLPRLAQASVPTAVLYTIRVAGTVRFIRLTADGATEIPLPDDAHQRLTQAVDGFASDVRSAAYLDDEISGLLRRLLAETGPVLGPVLAQAIEGLPGGRLIWVPQGALAGVPLQAAPCGDGLLIDAVSVMVSTSLASAITAMEPDPALPLRTAAIQGTYQQRQAPTDGGGRLLAMPGHPAPDEVIPGTPGQLSQAVAGSSLVHLACHGHFRWDDPLASTLQLGFDLSVGQLFDEVDFTDGSLVLLGTCDSGTIAQSDLNEGIGMPAGLIAGGARTVVGAGWPVAAPAAVGVCRKFTQGIAAGLASPEALRQATLWLREATLEDLRRELAAAGHPMAERIAAWPESRRQERAFEDPARWASYLHWGGAWRAGN